jgi:hypothetical protein
MKDVVIDPENAELWPLHERQLSPRSSLARTERRMSESSSDDFNYDQLFGEGIAIDAHPKKCQAPKIAPREVDDDDHYSEEPSFTDPS